MTKSKKLLIAGLSNNAKIAKYYFEKDTEFEVVGFCVDQIFLNQNTFCDLPVFCIENILETHSPEKYYVFVAIGYSNMNKNRENLYLRFKLMNYSLPNYISPKCSFLTNEIIGDNNFILEDNTIQPFVKIGSNNVIWSGNHIGHDVLIGNHNFISSHVVISGFTVLENNIFIGVNSTLRDKIKIANYTLIGAGSLIMRSTEYESVYISKGTNLYTLKSNEINI